MEIRRVDPTSIQYADFAARYGSVFNSPVWLQIYGDGLEVCGVFNPNNELVGVFNIYRATKAGLTYYLVPPYSPSNAFCYANPASSSHSRITSEKAVHDAIALKLKNLGGFLKLTSFPVGITDMQAYLWNGFRVTPAYTYRLSLNVSEADLLAGLSSEKRKSVRNAGKENVEAVLTRDTAVIRKLVKITFARKNMKLHDAIFEGVISRFANPENSFAFAVSRNGVPAACVFCVHDADTAYYLFGGYDDAASYDDGPFCMWNAILHAKKLGLKLFDFEGSMVPDLERYFRDFGGRQEAYYTVQRAWLPVELLMRVTKRGH